MITPKMTVLALGVTIASGCASNNPDARTLLDRIEFGEDETGCFRVTGTLDVGGNPFTSTNVAVSLIKRKGDDPPDC